MHKIWFPLGLRPWPHWGSLQRSPDPLAAFKEPTSKDEGWERVREREGKEEEGNWGEGKEGEEPGPTNTFA